MLFNLNKFGLSTIILNCFIHATHWSSPSQMNCDAASALRSVPCSMVPMENRKLMLLLSLSSYGENLTLPPSIRLSFSYTFASVGKYWLVSSVAKQMFAFCAKHNFFLVFAATKSSVNSCGKLHILCTRCWWQLRTMRWASPHLYHIRYTRYYPIWDQSLQNLDYYTWKFNTKITANIFQFGLTVSPRSPLPSHYRGGSVDVIRLPCI